MAKITDILGELIKIKKQTTTFNLIIFKEPKVKRSLLFSSLTLGILIGCGGSKNTDTPPVDEQKIPKLNDIKVSAAPLIKASEFQFSQNLKNGLFKRYQTRLSHYDVPENDATASPSTSKDFSQTNQQEQNVDEADRVKYDGEFLFIAANSFDDIYHDSNEGENYIRIMQRNAKGEMNQIHTLPYSEANGSEQNLYLHNNTLAILNYSPSYFSFPIANDIAATVEPYFYYGDNEFELSLIDVSQPSQAAIKHQFKIEGGLIDSRVIDGSLYIVSNYHPNFTGFDTSDNDEATVLANYQNLKKVQLAELTPNITNTTNQNSEELVTPDNCYISSDASTKDGFDSIITITKISLNNPDQRESLCVNTNIYGIYASESALYTHGTVYQGEEVKTVIHKFDLTDDTLNYVATGAVEGHLGGGQENLRLSEFNDDLRVVTTTNLPFDLNAGFMPFKHQLFVLQQQENSLAPIAKLPNDAQPTPIGKTNEQGLVDENIYAVRFSEDRAFIVTFRQIDPLYVVDLTDKTNPKIAGALEIPGYSAYLHPVGENLLLGIGQNIQDWRDPSAQEVENGAKVTLFDISDITKPKVVNEKVFANAYTPAEWNYKSLSFLATESGVLRFTMPVETWQSQSENSTSYLWHRVSELASFEIDTTETPALNYLGSSKVDYSSIGTETTPYVWGGLDRAVIHRDDLYYIHGNYIWHSIWQTPSDNKGPL
ncbi:Beta-propeller domain-containing protein [Pseudoalteromonas phenolica]|uniref:Beta-propeller domain-containing protein n=1 Tax=Pseudoalteromonas phenolica TaxID=161398 RepID=A0A0S2K7C3_9GAMM|nr:Beta-propeller domain-containing protein [Pseudoalteromonas phenolica]